jgi:hypothetical protein
VALMDPNTPPTQAKSPMALPATRATGSGSTAVTNSACPQPTEVPKDGGQKKLNNAARVFETSG